MSTPIKPPSSGRGAPLIDSTAGTRPSSKEVGRAGDTTGISGAGSFGQRLELVRAGEVTSSEIASSAPVGSDVTIEELSAALRAGRISPEEAIETLVLRALESPDARLLDDAGRAALESHLRESLASDPALRNLASDLDRS